MIATREARVVVWQGNAIGEEILEPAPLGHTAAPVVPGDVRDESGLNSRVEGKFSRDGLREHSRRCEVC